MLLEKNNRIDPWTIFDTQKNNGIILIYSESGDISFNSLLLYLYPTWTWNRQKIEDKN